jgi:hypothetical protein
LITFDTGSHVEESAQTGKYLDEKFARRLVPITSEDQPALLSVAKKAKILNDNARRFVSR